MTDYVVFGTGTPALTNETDGPIAVSTGFQINTAGSFWVTGVEFFAASVAPTGVQIALWSRSTDESASGLGTLLASKVAGTINAGVRNRIDFDTAVLVDSTTYANGLYATVYTANRYVATGGYFAAGGAGESGVTSGPITAYPNGSPGFNGRFKTTATGAADSYPTGTFNGGGYWVSPVVTDVDPSAGDTLEADGNRTGTGTLTGTATRIAGATGTRTLTGSLVGAATAEYAATGDRMLAVALAGAATVISDQPAEPTTNSGGWYGYLNILKNNAEEVRLDRTEPPVACPEDGEPLKSAVDGTLFCPFDGWKWSGIAD